MRKVTLLAVISLLLVSCQQGVVFTEFKALSGYGWEADSVVVFTPVLEDSMAAYDMQLMVRYTDRYAYQNLWLFVDVKQDSVLLRRDTIEAMLPGDLDVSAWELRKTLQAFAKCNPSLNEWLGSPIIYAANEAFLTQLQRMLPTYFNPIRATHHYLSLAHHAWSTQVAQEMTLKKLFYALRGLFCAMWSVQFKTMPPTRFDELLIPTLLPELILQEVERLKVLKKVGCEATTTRVSPLLGTFYEDCERQTRARVETLQYTMPTTAPLGALLQAMVHMQSF